MNKLGRRELALNILVLTVFTLLVAYGKFGEFSVTGLQTDLCGNNVVDVYEGEECDDGNTGSNDGCSSECTTESGTAGGPYCYSAATGAGDPDTTLTVTTNPTETNPGEACTPALGYSGNDLWCCKMVAVTTAVPSPTTPQEAPPSTETTAPGVPTGTPGGPTAPLISPIPNIPGPVRTCEGEAKGLVIPVQVVYADDNKTVCGKTPQSSVQTDPALCENDLEILSENLVNVLGRLPYTLHKPTGFVGLEKDGRVACSGA